MKEPTPKGTPTAPHNSLRRPVHKADVLARGVAAELNRKHPEPMSLMHKREKNKEIPGEEAAEINMIRCGRVYCPPEVSPGMADHAARAMANWDNSDPFAYGRTALHVKQGFIHPDDVIGEMTKRTLARQVAKRREVDNAKAHS